MIQVEKLTKIYGSGDVECTALRNLNFTIGDTDIVAITGPSGAGKSTLLRILAAIDLPTYGKVMLGEKDITQLSENERTELRLQKFGFVFQDYNLVSTLTAQENIILPASYKNGKYNEELYRSLIEVCGLQEKELNFPHELSGGEQQRVALCRALLTEPKVIFADEPTGNLDSKNANNIFDLLFTFAKKQHASLIYITHEPKFSALADYQIIIEDGVCRDIVMKKGN